MVILLWIVGIAAGLLVLVIVVYGLLIINAVRASGTRDKLIDKELAPVLQAVEANAPNLSELIFACAKKPATRNTLYAKLAEISRTELFPPEFRTTEMIAESSMVRWLMHANELGAAPEYINQMHEVSIEDNGRTGRCFLFRFQIAKPHWAAERGWMAGIAGPFWSDDVESSKDSITFSELVPYESLSDDEHVDFLKHAITRRGWVTRC